MEELCKKHDAEVPEEVADLATAGGSSEKKNRLLIGSVDKG